MPLHAFLRILARLCFNIVCGVPPQLHRSEHRKETCCALKCALSWGWFGAQPTWGLVAMHFPVPPAHCEWRGGRNLLVPPAIVAVRRVPPWMRAFSAILVASGGRPHPPPPGWDCRWAVGDRPSVGCAGHCARPLVYEGSPLFTPGAVPRPALLLLGVLLPGRVSAAHTVGALARRRCVWPWQPAARSVRRAAEVKAAVPGCHSSRGCCSRLRGSPYCRDYPFGGVPPPPSLQQNTYTHSARTDGRFCLLLLLNDCDPVVRWL